MVVAVPLWYTSTQRQAIKDAAASAGLAVLGLVNETTALVLAYDHHARHERGAALERVLVVVAGSVAVQAALVTIERDDDDDDDDDDGAVYEVLTSGALLAAEAAPDREDHGVGDLVRRVLADAGSVVHTVLLHGENADSPAVRAALAGHPPLRLRHTVAYGAAIYAAMRLSGGPLSRTHLLIERLAASIGMDTASHATHVLIPRNAFLPARGSVELSTYSPQFPPMVVACQGERAAFSENRYLGRFEFYGFQAAPLGVPRIDVRVGVDVDGILLVSARDVTTSTFTSCLVFPVLTRTWMGH